MDPTIAEKYAFTFSLRDEPLEQILRIMSRINPITYDFDENNNLTITAATKIKSKAYELIGIIHGLTTTIRPFVVNLKIFKEMNYKKHLLLMLGFYCLYRT